MADIGRKNHVYKAKLFEGAEHYDAMVKEVKAFVKFSSKSEPLTAEERALFTTAFQCLVSSKRSCWSYLSAKTERETDEKLKNLCKEAKREITDELKALGDEVIVLCDNKLIPCSESLKAKAAFLKMRGDYCRYMVEICDDTEAKRKDEMTKKSEEAYCAAMEIAKNQLEATHPVRLGVVLNYSVFMYDVQESRQRACDWAQEAFDEAVVKLDDSPKENMQDTMQILQLLSENLALWKEEEEDE